MPEYECRYWQTFGFLLHTYHAKGRSVNSNWSPKTTTWFSAVKKYDGSSIYSSVEVYLLMKICSWLRSRTSSRKPTGRGHVASALLLASTWWRSPWSSQRWSLSFGLAGTSTRARVSPAVCSKPLHQQLFRLKNSSSAHTVINTLSSICLGFFFSKTRFL